MTVPGEYVCGYASLCVCERGEWLGEGNAFSALGLDVQFTPLTWRSYKQNYGAEGRCHKMDWQVICGSCHGVDVTNRISSNNLLFSTCKAPEPVSELESRLGRVESAPLQTQLGLLIPGTSAAPCWLLGGGGCGC